MIVLGISKENWGKDVNGPAAQVVQLELRCDIATPLQGVASGLISNARGAQDPAVFTFLAICVVQAANQSSSELVCWAPTPNTTLAPCLPPPSGFATIMPQKGSHQAAKSLLTASLASSPHPPQTDL